MKFDNNLPEPVRSYFIGRIERRWSQLSDLLLSSIQEGMKFIFLINAGGCVAMLTFIGTAQDVRALNWPWLVLGLFFLGLVLIGCLHFLRYHAFDYCVRGFDSDVSSFYSGQREFSELESSDYNRVKKFRHIAFFAHASFFCFVLGGSVGLFNYSDLVKQGGTMKKLEAQFGDHGQKNHVPKSPPSPPPPSTPSPSAPQTP